MDITTGAALFAAAVLLGALGIFAARHAARAVGIAPTLGIAGASLLAHALAA